METPEAKATDSRFLTVGMALIRNVHKDTTVHQISQAFQGFDIGVEIKISLLHNRYYGLISFSDLDALHRAVAMNEVLVNGRLFRVELLGKIGDSGWSTRYHEKLPKT